MKIRSANYTDLDEILNIYVRARSFMRENGNPDQWGDSYPQKELVISDLESGRLRVLVDEADAITGVFSCFVDGDPDYDVINGKWLNDEPYTAIHRVASAGTHKGIFDCILDYCLTFSDNIKIDTYRDNTVMQAILKKRGFVQCGYITIEGLDFITFQLVK
jgi:ribosomal protein S18 acetylase RimI-like enzyme